MRPGCAGSRHRYAPAMANGWAEVEVREDPELPTVAVRVRRPMAGLDIGAIFGEETGRLAAHLAEHDETPAGPPYARYHEFGPERADIEIGFPVEQPPRLDAVEAVAGEQVGRSALPGGRRAVYLHAGPYPELGHAYAALERFLAEEGESSAGAPWESYLVMPDDVDGDPMRLRTEVCWPLA